MTPCANAHQEVKQNKHKCKTKQGGATDDAHASPLPPPKRPHRNRKTSAVHIDTLDDFGDAGALVQLLLDEGKQLGGKVVAAIARACAENSHVGCASSSQDR